jgi:membrane protease YdiL (CAAX protease family)
MNDHVELGSRRILKPGRWRWLRAIAWMFMLLVLVIGPAILVSAVFYAGGALMYGLPVTQMMEAPGPVHFAAMTAMSLTALATYAGWVRVGEERVPRELAVRPAIPELLAGLALGFLMMGTIVVIMWSAGWVTITAVAPDRVWRALAMAIESGVVEEVAVRLIIFRLLWRAIGPWFALPLSSLVFGVLHIVNPGATWFAALCITVEAGVMLATFYVLTGRLWVSIGLHAGWNFTQGWILGAPVSGTDFFDGGPLDLRPMEGVPEILSGGTFGPEASLAALLVGSGVGALTLWNAWRRGRLVTRDEAEPPRLAPSGAQESS